MSSIDTARELLVRTRNIGAGIDSMVRPHLRIIELRGELSKEPFTELDRAREVLTTELSSIEGLLGRGLVNEAWSAVTAYEGRVDRMMPLLRQLAGMRRGMRAMGAAAASPELTEIEEMVLGNDLIGAESALRSFGPGRSGPATPKIDAPQDAGKKSCTLCGRTMRAGLELCPFCGWEPGAPSAECPECGSTVLLSFRACPSCGKGLSESTHEGDDVSPPPGRSATGDRRRQAVLLKS